MEIIETLFLFVLIFKYKLVAQGRKPFIVGWSLYLEVQFGFYWSRLKVSPLVIVSLFVGLKE